MTKILCIFLVALFVLPTSEAFARRHHIHIYKPSPYARPSHQPATPLVAIPPAAVAIDLVRRTSCDPAIAHSTGPGDPGFDPKGPAVGNFLIPAIYRSECQGAQPRRY